MLPRHPRRMLKHTSHCPYPLSDGSCLSRWFLSPRNPASNESLFSGKVERASPFSVFFYLLLGLIARGNLSFYFFAPLSAQYFIGIIDRCWPFLSYVAASVSVGTSFLSSRRMAWPWTQGSNSWPPAISEQGCDPSYSWPRRLCLGISSCWNWVANQSII